MSVFSKIIQTFHLPFHAKQKNVKLLAMLKVIHELITMTRTTYKILCQSVKFIYKCFLNNLTF